MLKSLLSLFLLLIIVAPAARPTSVAAQSARCFADVPGISNCIDGRFREYWEQNGGLAVFGYPLTAATNETVAGSLYQTQYFERSRFELHPENKAPYDVLLGQLGAALLPAAVSPENGAKSGCLWFAETAHNVCDQESGFGFMSYWRSNGLLDPGLDLYGRSLALFGYPLTEARTERNSTGATALTQWFERARFEWVPGNKPEFRVLLGLLGTELLAGNPPNSGVQTGISGNVTIGPTCAGPTQPTGCEDQPYQATIAILDSGRKEIGSVQSDSAGYFEIALPAGTYILAPRSPGRYPVAAEQTVTVVAGKVTHVAILYDNGRR